MNDPDIISQPAAPGPVEPVDLRALADGGSPAGIAAATPGEERGAMAPADPDALVIDLADLLPDGQGEVVLFADESLPVRIATSEILTQSGIIDSHTTAAGVAVDGLHYYSFGNGLTLYSPMDIPITEPADVS